MDRRPFTPVDIPEGLEPRWERDYPGRLRGELNALQYAGIEPEVNLEFLRAGRLVLTFDWPLDSKTSLGLEAVYPDGFPHLRPQVFLLSGLNPMPVRHRSPLGGNMCLLGRDTRQWMPSWTLCKLLSKQLEDAVRGTGDEDPQGEPADYWWNGIGALGAYCLIDSDWDLAGEQDGTLRVRYAFAGYEMDMGGRGRNRIPIIRAAVTEVYDRQNKILHQWEEPLPPDVADSKKNLIIPWVRLEDTILPKLDLGEQLYDLVKANGRLQQFRHSQVASGLSVGLVAVIHPSELEFGTNGLGWVVFQVFGTPKAFKANAKQEKHLRKVSILPVYRAGPTDVGHRVPAVQLLREKRVLVVGTGAVGAPVAIELARNGCGALHLIEHDIVEPGNTVRWPLGATAWGRTKLEALVEFLGREYPATKVHDHSHYLGQTARSGDGSIGDDDILDVVLPNVDIVIDGTASHGVTTLLADRCRQIEVPLISLFATPTLEGGAVHLHSGSGGCPNCLEHAWYGNNPDITPPPGRGSEHGLTQPPGCAERTFIGAGYDLQELSLQAVWLAVETLSNEQTNDSVIHTLSFVDEDGERCPPRWRIDPLPKHPKCNCRP